MMAASTPRRSTAYTVTWVTRSGSRQMSRNERLARTWRYSRM